METRANYILIGLFTILGFLGLLGFLMWFTNSELDRQFAYYEARFDNVSGLSQASSVRFAGLNVGQVVDVSLSDTGDGTVTVRLEVAADTPVRTSSEATIESQGVTGVSYIGISSGDPLDALLRAVSDADVPEIPTGRSMLQSLTEDAPALVEQTLDLINDLSTLVGPENRERFDNIMSNLDQSSEQLTETLDGFSQVANSIGTSVQDIASFTEGLEGIAQSVESTLQVADDALTAIDNLSERANVTLDASTETFSSATRTLDTASSFIDGELRTALVDFTETSSTLRNQAANLSGEAQALLESWRDTGITATARLTQAESLFNDADDLIARLTVTLDTVDTTASTITSFVQDDARTAIAQVTDVVTTLDTAIAEDLPVIMDDIRAASATANETIATLSGDLTSASGRLDEVLASAETTLATVTDTFTRANGTLEAIDSAMETSEAALVAAEGAFEGADRIINDELAGIGADLRASVANINATIDEVADDIPAISADLRQTTDTARAAIETFAGIIERADAPVNSFLSDGLPQFTRLAAEGQRLLQSLDQLTRRLERDPARFLLGRETPEFRR